MLSTTTFLLSNTFLLSKFSPPSAAHAFNYIPFIKNIPFIKIFPPLCSPCFQLQHSFYQTHSFYHNFPPICSPCFQLQHSFYQKHSFYHNFPPLCSPCFQLHSFYQKILLSKFSPPLQPMLSMIHVTRGHLRPCLTSFYQNFSPPLQPMLSTTTFLLSNTFLLSQFSPPSAAHAFNDTRYQGSFATLPTTTRENTTRSLATLPTQIGRVTSDH